MSILARVLFGIIALIVKACVPAQTTCGDDCIIVRYADGHVERRVQVKKYITRITSTRDHAPQRGATIVLEHNHNVMLYADLEMSAHHRIDFPAKLYQQRVYNPRIYENRIWALSLDAKQMYITGVIEGKMNLDDAHYREVELGVVGIIKLGDRMAQLYTLPGIVYAVRWHGGIAHVFGQYLVSNSRDDTGSIGGVIEVGPEGPRDAYRVPDLDNRGIFTRGICTWAKYIPWCLDVSDDGDQLSLINILGMEVTALPNWERVEMLSAEIPPDFSGRIEDLKPQIIHHPQPAPDDPR